MLADLSWLKHSDGIDIELMESKDEGKCIKGFEDRVKEIKLMEDGTEKEVLAGNILDELASLPIKKGYGYIEPSDIAGIDAGKSHNKLLMRTDKANLCSDKLYNKVYGAWLGRCAGCLLGQPVEGWYSSRIEALLKGTNNYPIDNYMSSIVPENIKSECDVSDYPGVYGNRMKGWINNVTYMQEDDDINYTIMSLKIVEKYGIDFTPENVDCECAYFPNEKKLLVINNSQNAAETNICTPWGEQFAIIEPQGFCIKTLLSKHNE